MKIVPIITAAIVAIALYFLVFDRQDLMRIAGLAPAADSAATAADGDAAAQDAATAAQVAADDAPALVRVMAMASQARTIESVVVLRGETEAAREVTVAAETSGQVISEPLRKGAYVRAGDALCQLDPGTREARLAEARARLSEAQGMVPQAEAALAEARARVREADTNVNAARQLSEGGFASETRLVSAEASAEAALAGVQRAQSQLISAQAGIEAAQAAVATAEREITLLTVHAPFDGLLETDTTELGVLMQPGTPCATIVQLDPIKLVGFVPEANVSKVKLGAMAQGRLNDGATLAGRVTFLSRSADPATRTFRVEVEAPNADLAIRDGQTADILIESEGRTAHLIPQSALTLDDSGALGVRTVGEGNIVVFMPVTMLRDTVDGVWVTDLPDQVNVITVGQEFVIDGVEVDPTFSEAKG